MISSLLLYPISSSNFYSTKIGNSQVLVWGTFLKYDTSLPISAVCPISNDVLISLMRRKVTHSKLSQTQKDFLGHLNSSWLDVIIVHYLILIFQLWLCDLSMPSFQGLPDVSVDQWSICTLAMCGCLLFIRLSQVFSASALIDIWGPIIHRWGWGGGVVPCIAECLPAYQVPIDYMLVVHTHTHTHTHIPTMTMKDVSRHCQISPGMRLGKLLNSLVNKIYQEKKRNVSLSLGT